MEGANLVAPVEPDAGAGVSRVSGPAAEAGIAPGRPGESALGGWGLFLGRAFARSGAGCKDGAVLGFAAGLARSAGCAGAILAPLPAGEAGLKRQGAARPDGGGLPGAALAVDVRGLDGGTPARAPAPVGPHGLCWAQSARPCTPWPPPPGRSMSRAAPRPSSAPGSARPQAAPARHSGGPAPRCGSSAGPRSPARPAPPREKPGHPPPAPQASPPPPSRSAATHRAGPRPHGGPVYPHVCGGTSLAIFYRDSSSRLSPRVRGNRDELARTRTGPLTTAPHSPGGQA